MPKSRKSQLGHATSKLGPAASVSRKTFRKAQGNNGNQLAIDSINQSSPANASSRPLTPGTRETDALAFRQLQAGILGRFHHLQKKSRTFQKADIRQSIVVDAIAHDCWLAYGQRGGMYSLLSDIRSIK